MTGYAMLGLLRELGRFRFEDVSIEYVCDAVFDRVHISATSPTFQSVSVLSPTAEGFVSHQPALSDHRWSEEEKEMVLHLQHRFEDAIRAKGLRIKIALGL